MAYTSVTLNPTIEIHKIVTIHYFEYRSDFSFAGESHNFWEFLCVDKGEVEVIADYKHYNLKRGNIIFHKPNEFHQLAANRQIAPNLVVIAFECDSPKIDFFKDRLMTIDSYEKNLLAQIIIEAKNTFLDPLDNPYQTHMIKKEAIPQGAEQLIAIHLELLLLHLLRRYSGNCEIPEAKDTIKQKKNDEIYHRILEYLNLHLNEHLTIEQISKDTLVGKSQLQQLIREKQGCGVIDLFSNLKVTQAKQLIRDNHLNFTEISDVLGYSSIHYFSRQFKKLTGMTPSEYSSSIRGLSEIPK